MTPFQTNTKVKWPWGKGEAEGYVRQKYTQKITKMIKGTRVTRDASEINPAYLIEQSGQDQVLKLHSELTKA